MASTITITCPECDKLLKVPSQAEGKKVRCSACDATFIAYVEIEDDEEAAPRPKKAPANKAAKPKAPSEKVKPTKEAAKPAAAKKGDELFTPDTVAFGLVEEYLGRRCPDCANAIEDDDRICLHCGYDTLTRQKARTRKVQHVTGFDIFLWLLPGILCAIVVLSTLTGLVLLWMYVDWETFGDVWYAFVGSLGAKIYTTAMGLFIIYKAGRFAIKRLIMHPKPPEVELKLEGGRS